MVHAGRKRSEKVYIMREDIHGRDNLKRKLVGAHQPFQERPKIEMRGKWTDERREGPQKTNEGTMGKLFVCPRKETNEFTW